MAVEPELERCRCGTVDPALRDAAGDPVCVACAVAAGGGRVDRR
jgi:hypothetical protein